MAATWREKLDAAAAAFHRALEEPRRAQHELLAEILAHNAGTEFGRTHGFASIRDLAEYRRRVPAASFADFAPSIDRMMRGEQGVLIADPPIFFAQTSGTSGVPKHVGYPARVDREYWGFLGTMLWKLERDYPGSIENAFCLSGKRNEGRAPSGVTVGSASGFTRGVFAGLPFFYIAPDEVFEEPRFDARYYVLLWFALRKSLRVLTALNPSSLLTLFKQAEVMGPALADDLERGTLEAGPPGVAELAARLGPLPPPAPDVAARLRASLRAHGAFVPRDIWPDIRVIQTWKGGSSKLYLPALLDRLPGAIVRPLQSSSTEGAFLVPFEDAWTGGVPALTSSVIELLPAERPPEPDEFIDFADAKEGEGYRFAITNWRGMYRYLVDDVFYVEGWHKGLPILRYSHRHGLVSSLTGEKVTEVDVTTAMELALAATGLKISEFLLGPRWGDPPRYVLVVELDRPIEEVRLRTLLHAFEAALRESNVEYTSKRDSARLADPELVVVGAGEFERLKRARSASLGRSDAQVKLPRLMRDLIEDSTFAVQSSVGWSAG